MAFVKKKNAGHEHANCARRRDENAVLTQSRLINRKCVFRRGESAILEHANCAHRRGESTVLALPKPATTTYEVFRVLRQHERFGLDERCILKSAIL
jgi:hypothetical protein